MLLLLADIVLSPGSVIAWLIVGLISGFLAGRMMKGGGFGVVGDIVVGLIGSLIGGFLMGYFVQGTEGFVGSIFVAFIGACILIALTRLVKGKPAV